MLKRACFLHHNLNPLRRKLRANVILSLGHELVLKD
jgi:hypothetical protein